MKKLLIVFIFILPLRLNAQNSSVLEAHEVDSVATPNGGNSFLEKFISVNCQIPYMARVAKIDGIVMVSGIVDEKGKISSVSIKKGLRPDCDKEAIRVFSLFNAWKPAIKNGRPVSQKVTHQILFKSTENINFVDGIQLDYLDENFSFTNDSLKRYYVQKSPIDTLMGLSTKNIDIYTLKDKRKEKLFTTLKPYFEIGIVYSLVYPEPLRDTASTRIKIQYYDENRENNIIGDIFTFWDNGNLQQKRYRTVENPDFPLVLFYANGMVREWTNFADDKSKGYQTISWFPNGQIEKIILHETPLKSTFDITDMWSEDGTQIVKNGSGEAILKSYQSDYKILVNKGSVINSKKDGIWQGYFESSNELMYRENYKNGTFESGVSYEDKMDTLVYNNPTEVFAEYQGGMRGFGKHLQTTLKYPIEAFKKGLQGKAFIKFSVCTDGTLCDYRVSKSAGNSILDNEAIRVVKASSGKWNSAFRRGRKIKSKFTLPISFTLMR